MSAAVVVAAFTCASKLRRRRRLWVKRLYQRRLSRHVMLPSTSQKTNCCPLSFRLLLFSTTALGFRSTTKKMNDTTANLKIDRETENHVYFIPIQELRLAAAPCNTVRGFTKKTNVLISCHSCNADAVQLQCSRSAVMNTALQRPYLAHNPFWGRGNVPNTCTDLSLQIACMYLSKKVVEVDDYCWRTTFGAVALSLRTV